MQSAGWYLRRLRSMSPAEIGWRLRSAVRELGDRYRLASGSYGSGAGHALETGPSDLRLCDVEPGSWSEVSTESIEARWLRKLSTHAERIAAGRLNLFHLTDVDMGTPIDWNRDHESGRRVPLAFAPAIDYRFHAVAGDAKLVWEPNRHHQLVVLGRAYRATGESRFAAAAVDQISSWLDQCPPGRGMNWRSPLELAIRAINWVWTVDLVRPSGQITPAFESRYLESLNLHVWDIARKYSRGSSANNHLIGEAAGVFIAATCCGRIRNAGRLIEDSRAILAEQLYEQTYVEGCTREQAFGYHVFVLQFFLLAGVVARRAGQDFPAEYWGRLEKMFEFVAFMTEGGPLPAIGDADDGYVIDLDGAPADPRGLLACGAILFDRPDFCRAAGGPQESVRWLLGKQGVKRLEALGGETDGPDLGPRPFPHAGYYLLQHGRAGSDHAVSVLFDCGELGFGPIAAHGHADALSFTVRAFGGDLLVDPGTFDYFTYPDWREYFCSTRAHNTLTVDGLDQSVRFGPFMWGARAEARCVAWEPGGAQQRVIGEHDGYARLTDPVVHRRTLDLDGDARILTIIDELSMHVSHTIAVYFHFAERCALVERSGGRFELQAGNASVVLTLDPGLEPAAVRGSEDPILGWTSSAYHRKQPAWTISGTAALTGPARLVTTISFPNRSS